ncbi:MAG: hypothetical protein R6U50_00080 [Desulfobacterales bacterium]
MKQIDLSDCIRYIRQHKNPLILAGKECDHIKLSNIKLLEYAADLATKMKCPIAATGNTIKGLEKHQTISIQKAWLGELMASLKGEWMDPILNKRPDLLLYIGYRPEFIDGMISGLEGVGSVHLGPGKSLTAEKCVEADTLYEWEQWLKNFIETI